MHQEKTRRTLCKCDDVLVLRDAIYGTACVWLAARGGADCTVVDAGCGGGTNLHEIKRHLAKHGVRCATIGIDQLDWDTEADTFIRDDIRNVNLDGVADAVICGHVFSVESDPGEFRAVTERCASFLKPDGLLFATVGLFGRRAMTKNEAVLHARLCAGRECAGWNAVWRARVVDEWAARLTECSHGRDISAGRSRDARSPENSGL